MKITNRHGLPDAIVEAVRNDGYRAGDGDISVTSLISPPQLIALRRKHWGELEEDAMDRMWALLGQAVHKVLERADKSGVTEERVYGTYAGWKVGGQFDRLLVRDGVLQDYKITSAWSAIRGPKTEWVQQLNVLVQLCQDNGYYPVTRAEVAAIYRDWSGSRAAGESDYPQQPFSVVSIPVWPEAERRAFIEKRVRLHQRARAGDIEPCTDEERWLRGESWAVMRKGRKRAVKLYPSEAEAGANLPDDQHHIEHRPGSYARCEGYCPVAKFCKQFHPELAEAA